MPDPHLLQIRGSASLPQHRHPSVPESMKAGLRDFELFEKWMQHALEDIVAADR